MFGLSRRSRWTRLVSNTHPVAKHYHHGKLIEAIRAGVEAIGKTPETVTVDELAAADEFHIGGRQASELVAGSLDHGTG